MVRRRPAGRVMRHTAAVSRRRWSIGLTVAGVALLALAGCVPAPSPSPALTPPPLPSDALAWGDLVWSPGTIVDPPGGAAFADQVSAVTAGPGGFVAVGYHELGPTRDGEIWFSADGVDWTAVGRPGLLTGVEPLDVEVGPDGYRLLGTASGGPLGDHVQAVVFGSRDGRTWERLPVLPGGLDTFAQSIAVAEGRVLVTGFDGEGEPAAWLARDGGGFERIDATGTGGASLVDPEPVGDGFVALGGLDGPPTVLRSTDGLDWIATPVDVGSEGVATGLVVGRWGSVIQGLLAPGCGASASCAGFPIAWWSGDGTTWGRLPEEGSPVANGGSIVVPAGDHGFVAVDGASAWSSPDGWHWRPLPEPGDGAVGMEDAVVAGEVIVAVGTEYFEDATRAGRILVAR